MFTLFYEVNSTKSKIYVANSVACYGNHSWSVNNSNKKFTKCSPTFQPMNNASAVTEKNMENR